jgi:hypothetical protein
MCCCLERRELCSRIIQTGKFYKSTLSLSLA